MIPDSGDIQLPDGRVIPAGEVVVQASRSGGPGGQHVNTSSTKVEVRWNVNDSAVLTDDEKARIRERLAGRMGGEGTLRIAASDSRSQRRNRETAERRLAELVAKALAVPKRRRKTARPKSADRERLREKREHSERKSSRRWTRDE